MFCVHTKKYNKIKKCFSDTNSICLMPLSICCCFAEQDMCSLGNTGMRLFSLLFPEYFRQVVAFIYVRMYLFLFIYLPDIDLKNQRLETVNFFQG